VSEAVPRIKVELAGVGGGPTLYTGKSNAATLRLTNQSGRPVALAAGPPSRDPPSGGAFDVHLYLSAFFVDPNDAANLRVSAEGWKAEFFGGGEYPAWAIAPTAPLSWPDLGTIGIELDAFRPTVAAGTCFLSVELYNLEGSYVEPYTVVVSVENPPSPSDGNLRERALVDLLTKDVAITKRPDEPAQTELTLRLVNRDPTKPLVPPNVPWGPIPPEFTLSFVYVDQAPGYYALTTPDKAKVFQLSLRQGNGWEIYRRDAVGGPQWKLRPVESRNHAILGTQDAAIAEFRIGNVQTQFVDGPTLMYVQYTNVPGFNDGYFTVLLDKVYQRMAIRSFTINQTRFPAPPGRPAVGSLNWDVDASVLVELSGKGPVPPHARAHQVQIEHDEEIVLTAYDTVQKVILSQSVVARVDPPMSLRWVPCGGIVLWSGAVDAIPPGFALCDGTRGTPDLKDRFVIGAGAAEAPHAKGESAHVHALDALQASTWTAYGGSHTHRTPGHWYWRVMLGSEWWTKRHTGIDIGGSFFLPIDFQGVGDHRHSVNPSFPSQPSGPVQGGLRPRWYALCYVMKLYPDKQ